MFEPVLSVARLNPNQMAVSGCGYVVCLYVCMCVCVCEGLGKMGDGGTKQRGLCNARGGGL